MKNKTEKNQRFSQYNFLKKNRKGISGVVAAVIMIALVMAVGVIVWVVIRNLIVNKLENVGSCVEVFDKVTINSRYTCYDTSEDEFHFSIKVGDIEVEKILVAISSEGSTNSYELSDVDNDDLDSYPDSGDDVLVPGKNSGRTYILSISTQPDYIEIAPIVNGQQCEISDSLFEIDSCWDLA